MTTETAIVVVLWLLLLLVVSPVLVGFVTGVVAGCEVDNDDEVDARSVA